MPESPDDPFAGPVRFCVDRFLPDHLHAAAGRLSLIENPALAVSAVARMLASGSLLGASAELLAALAAAAPPEPHQLYSRLGLMRSAKWEPGRVIAIGFYDDAPAGVTAKVMDILADSSRVLNLSWRQVPVGRAEYRVAFRRGNGLWSLIGSQCLAVPLAQGPTCNLGDVNWADPRDLVRCVRHEIVGHGTGCLHGQQLASYAQLIDLDTEAIVRYYMQSQGWSYQQAMAQFQKVDQSLVEEGFLSRTSIMNYEVNPIFDRRKQGIPWVWDWDLQDQAQFRKSYPGRQPTGPDITPGAPPPTPSPPEEPLPSLPWGDVKTFPMPAGGLLRAALAAKAPANAILRVVEDSSGQPLLDVVPPGGAPFRIPPNPALGFGDFMTAFPFRLRAAGSYELHVSFKGPAPNSLFLSINTV